MEEGLLPWRIKCVDEFTMEQVLLADQARAPTPKSNDQVASTESTTEQAQTDQGSSTDAEAGPSQPMPSNQSLEAEMDQVMQSLGKFGTGLTSFWGDLRKQGSTAYAASLKRAEAARKDLAPYMDQAKPYMDSAKAELAKTREEMAKLGKELNKSPEQLQAERGSDAALETTPTPSFYGEVLQPGDAISNTQVGPSAPMLEVNLPNPSAFFDKLQSQIASNPNLASLQANLKENFSRVGPMASTGGKMAEAYLHKGEEYIKHAGKDLETFLNQAVRIVPGEESSSGTSPPSSSSAGPATDTKGKSNSSAQMIQLAGRKEQLLHRLATNQAIFLIDPTEPLDPSSTTVTSTSGSASEATKETFDAFMHDVQGQGGFDSPQWQERIQATLADPKMAPLKSTMDSLVPEKISTDTFWARYFFRVTQIEADDARRKQVLQTAAGQQEQSEDDDFSWDNEDDADAGETPSPMTAKPTSADTETLRPADDNRRQSSESEQGTSTSSYDVVSSQPSASGPSSDVDSKKTKPTQTKKDDDSDSDWE